MFTEPLRRLRIVFNKSGRDAEARVKTDSSTPHQRHQLFTREALQEIETSDGTESDACMKDLCVIDEQHPLATIHAICWQPRVAHNPRGQSRHTHSRVVSGCKECQPLGHEFVGAKEPARRPVTA